MCKTLRCEPGDHHAMPDVCVLRVMHNTMRPMGWCVLDIRRRRSLRTERGDTESMLTAKGLLGKR